MSVKNRGYGAVELLVIVGIIAAAALVVYVLFGSAIDLKGFGKPNTNEASGSATLSPEISPSVIPVQ